MLHTKFRGNQSAGSGEEDFEGFYHIWAWLTSWSCDQHHINDFISMYLKAYIKKLVKTAQWFLRKAYFNFHTEMP